MNSTSEAARILLFPSCDRDGLLLDAIERADDGPVTRADAMLFGWMLGLDAAVDAVGAARAVLAVAAQQNDPPRSSYRRALIDGLERFVADRGRVASLSANAAPGGARPRRRWRDRESDAAVVTTPAKRDGEERKGAARRGASPNRSRPRD